MAYVPVPKDLTKVKTKVMFNLTKRQLICFTGGALIGVPLLKVAVIRPKQRPYQTNNFYAVLKRQEMLDKEVYDIVHRNKKMAASDVRENRKKRPCSR